MIQFQEKTNDTIPDRQKDRRTEGQKDRQTLFHKILPAKTRGPKNKKLIKINKQKNKNKKQINKQTKIKASHQLWHHQHVPYTCYKRLNIQPYHSW